MNDAVVDNVEQRTAPSLTQRLAEYVATTRYEAIPPSAIETAKLYLLDTLAVAWAGSDAPGCQEAHALMVDEGGRSDATAWAYGGKLPAASAAFINGMSSSALDYDSLYQDASVHINIAVLPAALAIAEREHVSGRDFLTALIVGSDIAGRFGGASRHPPRGFHYTGVFGTFGAAAAAAKLLRLDALTTRHALGLAFMQVAGTQQANIEPSLSKRLLSAFAARSGVNAALLAQRGITSPAHAIEGKFGLYSLYQDGDGERLIEGLGKRFESERLTMKKFPSCGCNHTSIQGMLDLVRGHDLKPDDVESIEVTVSPYMDRIVGGPYDPSSDPQVAAQFNLRYSVACVLVRRRLGLAEIEADAAHDPEINRHIPKVSLKINPELKSSRGPVVIRMRTRTHGELTCRVDHVPGGAEAPLAESEVREKLDDCLRLGVKPLRDGTINMLLERTRQLDTFSDMSQFFAGIC
jgi:2-methylcitrate dehydratase PrpD